MASEAIAAVGLMAEDRRRIDANAIVKAAETIAPGRPIRHLNAIAN